MAKHAAVRASLQAQLDELIERAQEIEVALCTPGSSDWEENAIESEDDEVLASVSDTMRCEIAEIQLAIHLIDSGHYGICTKCQKAISPDRLAAIPYATRCIDCV
jgi:DnaK suppressor protein